MFSKKLPERINYGQTAWVFMAMAILTNTLIRFFVIIFTGGQNTLIKAILGIAFFSVLKPIFVLTISVFIVFRISAALKSSLTITELLFLFSLGCLPAIFLETVVLIFPAISMIQILSFYGVYIFYAGVSSFDKIAERHFISFLLISVIIFLACDTIIQQIFNYIYSLMLISGLLIL